MQIFNIKKIDIFGGVFFLFIWIIPMAYTGLTNIDFPLMPRVLTYWQRTSFLFPYGIKSWPVYYIQAQFEGEPKWTTLDESQFFKLKPFGYRTRLHQFFYARKDISDYAHGNETELNRQRELALWVQKRYQQLHTDAKPITKVRFIAGFYIVGDDPAPRGHWQKPELEFFSKHLRRIISTHNL